MNIDVWKILKRLYKSAVKFDDQQQYKAVIISAIFSTPEGFTNDSPMLPRQYLTTKRTSAGKSLRPFLDTL